MSSKFMFLDVESIGLYGEPFAVAAVITNGYNETLDEFIFSIDRNTCLGSPNDVAWVKKNIPDFRVTHNCIEDLYRDFFLTLKMWNSTPTLVLVCDCPFPVETNFLTRCFNCVGDFSCSPYPLLDLGSILYAKTNNVWAATGTYDRRDNELPSHNPLMDCRQTARLFFEDMR